MPVFETPRGSRLNLVLPTTEWPELQEAARVYRELTTEYSLTQRRLRGLENDRERAIRADRDALAQAIREGKPDPGDKKIEQIEREISACRRRIEALDVALDEAESDLIDVVDEHKADWVPQVQAEVAAAQQVYADAVEALAQARHAVSAKFSLLRWVEHFPEEEMTFKVRGSYVGKLKALHGDPYMFDQVVEALREDAKPAFAVDLEDEATIQEGA